MSTKIVQTEKYLLLIQEEVEIEEWDYYYDLESKLVPIKQSIENSHKEFKGVKIIAYYPLTKEAKELNLPLLPNPFKEEDIEKLAIKSANDNFESGDSQWINGFIEGYKTAQSNKQLENFINYFNEIWKKFGNL